MKRFVAFLLGIIVGWVLLIGGIVAAVFIITPSKIGFVNDEWQNAEGERFDEMSFGDIIVKGVDLTTSQNLTFTAIQNTYGIDVLGQFGLKGEEYDALRNTNISQVFSNPKEALSDVKLADLLSGSLGESFKVPQAVISKWRSNAVSVGDLIGGNFQTLLNSITLSDLTSISESASGLEKILSDKDLGELYSAFKNNGSVVNVMFEGNSLGELMGFTYDETDNVWLNADGTALDATTNAVAKTLITVLLNGNFKVENAIGELKVGELMGYTRSEADGKWTDKNGNELTDAIGKKIADVSTSKLLGGEFKVDEELSDLTIGEIMKYTKGEDGIWRDSSNQQISKLMSTFAEIKVSELTNGTFNVNDKIDNLFVGDLLEYTYDEINQVWLDGGGNKVNDVIFNNIYSKRMSDMRNGLNINEILEGVKIKEVITINETAPEIMKIIADKNILTLSEEMHTIYVGQLQGYTRHEMPLEDSYDTIVPNEVVISGTTVLKKVNNKWYVAKADCKDPAHTLATHTSNCYKVVWYTDNTYSTEVKGINEVISNNAMDDIDIDAIVNNIKLLPYTEVIDADPNSGALSLISTDTKICDLPDTLSNAVENATIQQLMNAGLLEITPANQSKLDTVFGGNSWESMTFETFISEILNKISTT